VPIILLTTSGKSDVSDFDGFVLSPALRHGLKVAQGSTVKRLLREYTGLFLLEPPEQKSKNPFSDSDHPGQRVVLQLMPATGAFKTDISFPDSGKCTWLS